MGDVILLYHAADNCVQSLLQVFNDLVCSQTAINSVLYIPILIIAFAVLIAQLP